MLQGTYYTARESARYTNLPESVIRRWIRNDIVLPTPVGNVLLIDKTQLDSIRSHMETFVTQTEIANRYGISRQRVHKLMKDRGIEPHPVQQYKRNAKTYHVDVVAELAESMGWGESNESPR